MNDSRKARVEPAHAPAVRDRPDAGRAATPAAPGAAALLQTLMDSMPESIYFKDAAGRFTRINASLARFLGLDDPGDAVGRSDFDFYPAESAEQYQRDEQEVMRTRTPLAGKLEACAGPDGSVRWFLTTKVPMLDGDGGVSGVAGISRDVTERHRAEALYAGQARVLELLAEGRPLGAVLEALVQTIEGQSPGVLGSILLLDDAGVHLRHGAAPSLPAEYVRAIDGTAIGPNVGSCGTAAYRGERVVAEDIATDPRWVDYRDLALPHGLRSCWSQPIRSTDGQVLGTFAMYYLEPRRPTGDELSLIDTAARLARVAIERHRVERALRREEQLLHILMENVPDAIYFKDETSRFTRVNRAQARYLGLDDPEEAVGRRDDDFFVPGTAREYRADEQTVIASGDPLIAKIEHDGRPETSRRWLSTTKVPIRGPDGAIVGTAGVSRDITGARRAEQSLRSAHDELERRVHERTTELLAVNERLRAEIADRERAEAARRESEARVRSITESVLDFIIQVDLEGTIHFINRTLPGLRREDVVGTSVFEWMPADRRDVARQAIRRVGETGEPQEYETHYQGRDGQVYWFETRVGPVLLDGRVRSVILAARDTTERKRAEDARLASEALFKSVLAAVPDVMLVLDAEGRYRNIFTSEPRLLVQPADRLLDRTIHEMLPAEEAKPIQEQIDRAIRSGVVEAFEYPLQIAGESRWFSARVVRFVVEDEPRVLWVARDITRRKQMTDEVRQLEGELAHAVRLSTMGEMASGIAHELNQPLAAIVNYVESCMHELRSGVFDLPTVLDDLEQVDRQAIRAAEIIRRVSGLVRKEPPHHGLFAVNEIIDEVVQLLAPVARQDGVVVRTRLADGLPRVMVDRIQIQQVLVNLALNGVEAMVRAGGDVREIEIESRRAADGVEISVDDSGSGIPPEIVDRVFEPFFTTKPSGTGLGLSLARRIVEAHGGRLVPTAGAAAGARLMFRLPAGEDHHD